MKLVAMQKAARLGAPTIRALPASPFLGNVRGNNPLKFTDPTGFGWFSDFIGGAWDFFTAPFREAWRFVEKNWRTIVVITVSAVVTAATGGVGGMILAGALSGGLSAALYGGDLSDILAGSIKGALFAGVSAMLWLSMQRCKDHLITRGRR